MATRQATVWFLLRRNICSITFPKFAFSISATRTQGKKWLSRPSRYIKCSLHAKSGLEQISQGFIGLFSVEEGDGWNPPFSSLAILAEELWQAWGRGFNTSLTSLERNQEAMAPWPVDFSLGREGTSKPRGFWALSHLFSWFYKTIPAL